MSVPTTLQSKLIPFAVSPDGVTYKNVVCLKVWNFGGETTTTEEETQCGTFTGLNANKSTFDFELLVNTTPDSDEVSAAAIFGYWNNQTQIHVRVQPGTGLNLSGPGYLTSVAMSAQVGSLMSMSCTFSLDGDPTVS